MCVSEDNSPAKFLDWERKQGDMEDDFTAVVSRSSLKRQKKMEKMRNMKDKQVSVKSEGIQTRV